MASVFKNAVAKRLDGGRPSMAQAFAASVIAGVAAAVLTYRVMRN